MPPAKKRHDRPADRQRAYEKRQENSGRRRVCVWIGADAADRLKKLAQEAGETMGDAVERLIPKK